MNQVTLYGKPDCALCDEVKQVIMHVAKRRRFWLVVKNILDDANDYELYHEKIPVVCVNGGLVTQYRLTQAQLEAALAGDGHARIAGE